MEITELCQALLRIESITGNEYRIAQFTADHITRMNPSLRVARYDRSIVAHTEIDPARKTIAFFGHLDTVSGEEVDDKVRIDGDKLIGLGASDMKGGIAVMLSLLESKVVAASRYNLIFVFYHAEEGTNSENGIHLVLSESEVLKRADFAFVLEPTNNELHLGCVGSLRARLQFHGKRAHSARPWEGSNAIHAAFPVFANLSSFESKTVIDGGLEFREVLSITAADGGRELNVVPDLFELSISFRFAPGKSTEDARREFLQIVGPVPEVEIVSIAPACRVPAGNQILQAIQSSFNLKAFPKQATTDVAHLNLAGIDAVNFGPGLTSQAHQSGEYILISDLKRSFEIYRSFLT